MPTSKQKRGDQPPDLEEEDEKVLDKIWEEQSTVVENAEGKWWDEEAERVNRMAELAKKKDMTIKVAPKTTPKLAKDGSYAKPKE